MCWWEVGGKGRGHFVRQVELFSERAMARAGAVPKLVEDLEMNSCFFSQTFANILPEKMRDCWKVQHVLRETLSGILNISVSFYHDRTLISSICSFNFFFGGLRCTRFHGVIHFRAPAAQCGGADLARGVRGADRRRAEPRPRARRPAEGVPENQEQLKIRI